jgi:hypothetical protein
MLVENPGVVSLVFDFCIGFSTNKYYLKKIQSKTTTKNNPWVFNKQILSQQNPKHNNNNKKPKFCREPSNEHSCKV